MAGGASIGPVSAGPLGDTTTWALQQALRGLSARQRVVADNIANIQTPGFRAGRVDFESSLASALGSGRLGQTELVDSRSDAPTRNDGNNVNLDDETVESTRTQLAYQTSIESMNAKLRLLRSAIAER